MTHISAIKAMKRPALLILAFTLVEICAVLAITLVACATATAFMAIVDGLYTGPAATRWITTAAPTASIASFLLAALAATVGLVRSLTGNAPYLLAIVTSFVSLAAFLQFRTLCLVEPPPESVFDTLMLASQASAAAFSLLGGFWLYVRLCRRAHPASLQSAERS